MFYDIWTGVHPAASLCWVPVIQIHTLDRSTNAHFPRCDWGMLPGAMEALPLRIFWCGSPLRSGILTLSWDIIPGNDGHVHAYIRNVTGAEMSFQNIPNVHPDKILQMTIPFKDP